MRIFIYKTLFVFLCILIVYKITIGNLVSEFEGKLDNLSSKENLLIIKEKIRGEISNSIEKDQILNKEDAILIKKFLNKIKDEIN
jgi:hypothetical protein